MKKLLIPILILLIGCTTTEKMKFQELYEERVSTDRDIEGDISVRRMIFYRDLGMGGSEIVSIMDRKREDSFYLIEVRYDGLSWRFMDNLRIKTDENLYTLSDPSPIQEVLSGSRVLEVMLFPLTEEQLNDLKTTESLTMQWWADPVPITREALNSIHNFIDTNENYTHSE